MKASIARRKRTGSALTSQGWGLGRAGGRRATLPSPPKHQNRDADTELSQERKINLPTSRADGSAVSGRVPRFPGRQVQAGPSGIRPRSRLPSGNKVGMICRVTHSEIKETTRGGSEGGWCRVEGTAGTGGPDTPPKSLRCVQVFTIGTESPWLG